MESENNGIERLTKCHETDNISGQNVQQVLTPNGIFDKYQYTKYLENEKKILDFPNKIYVSRNGSVKIDLEKSRIQARKLIKSLPSEDERAEAYQILIDFERLKTNSAKYLKAAKGEAVSGSIKTSLDEYSTIIFEMYGRFFTTAEILDILVNKYGIKTNNHDIAQFRIRNKDKIESIQRDKENDYFDVSLSKKRGRAERLEYLYNVMNDEVKRDGISTAQKVSAVNQMRMILSDARKEFEKDEIKITIEGQLTIDVAIKEETKKRDMMLNTMCFVIASVAAKNQLNSTYIMQKLLRGWYSKWNGIGRFKPDESVQYPSEFIFDLDSVEHLYLQNQENEKKQMFDSGVIIEDDSVVKKVALSKEQIKQTLNKYKRLMDGVSKIE